MRTVLRVVLAVSLLGGVAACSIPAKLDKWTNDVDPPELKADRASLQGQGFSEDYIDGHVDGCATGYKSAGNMNYSFYKDSPQGSGADYMQGWNIGFALCKGRYTDYATHATPPAKKE
ncbi:MAG TPA: hypothetical protein VL424_18910 [Pararobbsia sp.]|nr:hypothetical protein [Pararobbsia sp.]